jgi:hypothetical protein
MNVRIALVAVFLAAVAHAAAASEVHVTFRTPLETPKAGIAVTLHARSETGAEATATFPLSAGGTLQLADGLWEVAAVAPHYWSRPMSLQVAAAPSAVELPLFRSVTVRGEVSAAAVRQLTIGFAPPPATPPSALPSGSVICPVTSRRFVCDVPSGLLDLTFRASGWIALYRWKESLDADRNFGTLALQRGSSFTGTVTFAERQPKKAPAITVSVWADSPVLLNDDQKQRVAIARQNAKPNERGFFQFALAPGDYLVEATADGGLHSERRNIRILEARESQLRTPLVLERPHTLTIHVDPPLAPYGKPWTVTLARKDHTGATESETNDEVPASGEWHREGLFSGSYALSLGRSREDAWYSTPIEIAGADVMHDVRVPTTHISGKVTLGGKPLRTNVWFSDNEGKRAGIRSRVDGTYGPILMPDIADDTWPFVEVTNDEPYIRRTFTKVKLKRLDDENRELDLELKGATVFGDVVDEKGVIQTNALINATFADGRFTQIESPAGNFILNAVAPGALSLRADTHDGSTAGATIVDVSGDESTEVHLVVKPGFTVSGIVRSLAGPIGGAGIASISLEQWGDYLGQTATDEEGRFRLFFSPGTSSALISVNAPGYAYRMLRLAVRTDAVPVIVESSGGTLILTPPPKSDDDGRPYLIHAGAIFPLGGVGMLSSANVDATGRIAIPLAEEGAYSLCMLAPAQIVAAANGWLSPDRCASGLLPRGGALTLEVPARAARAQ